MGVRLTYRQKEEARRALAPKDPVILDFSKLAYAFEAANHTNISFNSVDVERRASMTRCNGFSES